MSEQKDSGQPVWSNIVAGIGLGIVLLAAFYISGRGLGGSGAYSRLTTSFLHLFAPEHVEGVGYFSQYFKGGKAVLNDWLVFQLIGLMLGGFFAAITSGRFKKAIDKGEKITVKQRFVYALIGGGIMGWGARLARGCTSGQALTGSASFAVGSWAFMLALFAGGFLTALFFRRLWL